MFENRQIIIQSKLILSKFRSTAYCLLLAASNHVHWNEQQAACLFHNPSASLIFHVTVAFLCNYTFWLVKEIIQKRTAEIVQVFQFVDLLGQTNSIFCNTTFLAMKFWEIVTGVGVINVKFFKFNIKVQLFTCLSGHKQLVNSQV